MNRAKPKLDPRDRDLFDLADLLEIVNKADEWMDNFISSTAGEYDAGAKRLSRQLSKARRLVCRLESRLSEIEYPIAQAMKSFRCPKCREVVRPACAACGFDVDRERKESER